jgi:acetyltransferase-like isoleucine patch superfamily enzyme
MVGTFGLVTKDLDEYNVAIGMPAHAKRLKPDAPDAVAARHPELKR